MNIEKDFKKKKIVLTGYSSGIGKVLSENLITLGCQLILIGRKKNSNNKSSFYKCDLANLKDLEKTSKLIVKENKVIDGFVHCAGENECIPSEKITIDNWNRILSVNLTAAFIISKEIKKSMLKSRHASIVYVSSIAGHRKSVVSGCHYVVSKSGLLGLARQLSQDFKKTGVRVNCISPSQTSTRMLEQSMNKKQINNLAKNIPLGRLATVNEQVYGIIFLLSSFASYINGASLNIDGGQI